MSDALIIALATTAGSLIGGVIGGLFARRKVNAEAQKNNADATTALSEAATKIAKTAVDDLLEPLRKRLDEMEARSKAQAEEIGRLKRTLARYGSRVVDLMKGIEVLVGQIKAKGEDPGWMPDEWGPNEEAGSD